MVSSQAAAEEAEAAAEAVAAEALLLRMQIQLLVAEVQNGNCSVLTYVMVYAKGVHVSNIGSKAADTQLCP